MPAAPASPDYVIHYVAGTITVTGSTTSTGPTNSPAPVPAVTIEGVALEKVSVLKGKKHKKEEAVVVQFSGGLGSGAQNLGNYSLVPVPHGKKKSKPVLISQAVYNASAFTVTLTPKKQPVKLKSPLQFTIDAAGLTDPSGRGDPRQRRAARRDLRGDAHRNRRRRRRGPFRQLGRPRAGRRRCAARDGVPPRAGALRQVIRPERLRPSSGPSLHRPGPINRGRDGTVGWDGEVGRRGHS